MESESIINNVNNNTANTSENLETSNTNQLCDTNLEPITVENNDNDNNKPETNNEVKDILDTAIENKMEDQDGYESSDLELSSDDDDDDSVANAGNNNNRSNRIDEDEDEGIDSGPVKTKNEMTDIPKIEIPDYTITPDMDIEYIGNVLNIIDKAVIIQSNINPKNVLDMESLLCFEDRSMLGEVFETFGPVAKPFYSVRFNTKDEVPNVSIGAKIFWVPSYAKSQTVQVEVLKLIKGSDASNRYDEEIDESELEFSDDEKELEYRQMRKRAKRNKHEKMPSTPIIPPDLNQGRQIQSYADITSTSNHPDHLVSTLLANVSHTSNQQLQQQQQEPAPTKSIKSLFDQPPPPSN